MACIHTEKYVVQRNTMLLCDVLRIMPVEPSHILLIHPMYEVRHSIIIVRTGMIPVEVELVTTSNCSATSSTDYEGHS